MGSRVTIGDFSRASHLTVKTLRHYHEAGLLEPSDVDPDSGYRYYSADQIPVAQVIRRLRNLRMPVAEVKAVLAAPATDARNRLIAAHLSRLESELARTRATVSELRDLLEPQAPHPIHTTTPHDAPLLGPDGHKEAQTWNIVNRDVGTSTAETGRSPVAEPSVGTQPAGEGASVTSL